MTLPVSCTLTDSAGAFDVAFGVAFDSFVTGNVTFDVLDYEADDYDDTWFVFELFNSTVGS